MSACVHVRVAGGESLALRARVKAEISPYATGCYCTPVRYVGAEKRLRCIFGKASCKV